MKTKEMSISTCKQNVIQAGLINFRYTRFCYKQKNREVKYEILIFSELINNALQDIFSDNSEKIKKMLRSTGWAIHDRQRG